MRIAVVFGLLVGIAAAGAACSSFREPDEAPDAGPADDAAPADATTTDVIEVTDASDGGPLIRWSFEDSGAASTKANGDTFLLSNGATYGPGILGQGLKCPRGAFAETVPIGSPFLLGNGDATFILWVSLDPNSEDAGDAGIAQKDYFHTFFDRHVNWASSQNPAMSSGYGFGYVHTTTSYLQGAITDGSDASTGYQSVRGNVDISDGQFHMVAFVVERTQLSLYADGRFVNGAAVQRPLPNGTAPDSTPIHLCDVSSNTLRGTLDELMIFPRALTADEIMKVKTEVEGM